MITIDRNRRSVFAHLAIGLLVIGSTQLPERASGQEHRHALAEPATAEAVLDAFHHALEEGNGEAALHWLAENALILESGVAQSKEEYADHHLGSDMAFLAKVQAKRLSREFRRVEGVVIVITRTRLKGTLRDREIDLVSSETAVLKQVGESWSIQHLHWSN